jgi:dihydroorotase
MMGLELTLGVLLSLVRDNTVTLSRLIDALSTRPGNIAGIAPPSLKVGALAEFVLVDPEAVWSPADTKLQSKSRNSPFMAHKLRGRVAMTVANGRVVYEVSP